MKIQITTGMFVPKNILVNPFVTDRVTHLFSHSPHDLLRAQVYPYQLFHEIKEAPIDAELGFTLTVDLHTHFDGYCNACLIMTCFKQCIYSVPLLLRELFVGSHLCTSLSLGRDAEIERLLCLYPRH